MSSIPGPIIVFRVGGDDLSGALRPQFDKIKNDAKATSNQIAQDWQVMSAKIRASIATEASSTKEVTAARKELIGVLGSQLSAHSNLSTATTKELANIKAMTLELERQQSFLKNKGGLTAGTANAMNQVSTQTLLGLERALDSFVDRYFGGVAGALTRTVRDVGYYAAQAGGKGGIGGGISGALSSIGSINPNLLGAGIGVATLAATGAAVAAVTHQMMEYAQSIQNVSAATGLSYSETQKFRELAKITGLDVDTLTMSFGRIQAELGKFIVSGKDSEGATQNFVKVLDRFGVSVTDANGKLRPISGTMGDFFTVLDQIPDEATRTAIAMDAMGIRGKVLVQLFSNLRAEGLTLTEALAEVRKATLDDDKIKQLLKEKKSWDDMVVSIDAAKVHLEAFIATHKSYLGPAPFGIYSAGKAAIGGILSYGDFVGAPGEQGALPLGKGAAGTPTKETAYALQFEDAKKLNAELQKKAEIIRAGGKLEFDLKEAEKKYAQLEKEDAEASAIGVTHLHGVEELALAKKIESLKEAIKHHKEEIALALKGSLAFTKMMDEATLHPGRPRKGAGSDTGEEPVDVLIERFLKYGTTDRKKVEIVPPDRTVTAGPGGALTVSGLLSSPFVGGGAGLAGIIGPQTGPPKGAQDLIDQINKEHDDLFKTQREIDIEHYAEELKDLNDALHDQLISHEQYGEALKKLQADRNQTLIDADKKFNDQAGKLFDDLITGNVKGFAKSLEKDVLESLLASVKKKFSEEFGNILGNLDRGATSVSGGGAGAPQAGGVLGKIFGGIFGGAGKVGPGGTAGFFPGSLGIGSGSSTAGAGQFGVATMTVTAGVVNLTGSLGLPGTGPLGGGGSTGNFFGNLNPFSSDNSLPITAQASARAATAAGIGGGGSASSSASGASGIFSALGPFLAGGALLGMGLGTKNANAAIMGAASLTGAALTTVSKSLASASGISNLSDTLGMAGKALPGIGMFAAGIQKGGVGGDLEAAAGGAQAGAAFGGPVGAAIGGAVGLISGIVSSIISGPSFAHQVQQNMYNQQYHAPPSETFSFAMGNTIQDTLSTGFNQFGSHFGTFGLPSGTPFWADPITGRLSKDQQIDLAEQQMGLLSNQPFLGFPTTDPYVGQGPVGRNIAKGSSPQVTNITIHAMDSESLSEFTQRNAHIFARASNSVGALSSSGSGWNVRRLAFPP